MAVPRPPADDPRVTLGAAEVFTKCAMLFFDKVISRQPGTLLGEYQAVVMNFTFAIELYLKTLWLIEEKPHPKGRDGHDLRRLYDGLPVGLRQELEARYDATYPKSTDPRREPIKLYVASPEQELPGREEGAWKPEVSSLPNVLKAAKDDFTKWRYLHEHSRADEPKEFIFDHYGLAIARDVLHEVAHERLRAMLGDAAYTPPPDRGAKGTTSG